MRPALHNHLQHLPRLSAPCAEDASPCRICAGPTLLFDVVDFNKFCSESAPYQFGLAGVPVYYRRCAACGFIHTGFFDDWTPADFAAFVYNQDYERVDGEYLTVRPEAQATHWGARLAAVPEARILDYGAGTGVFAEKMRAQGFEITAYDPISHPERPRETYDIITCFEVMEHAPRPLDLMRDIVSLMRPDGCIVFTTGIQPADIARQRGQWWYIGPRNGHVSIYSEPALMRLGACVGLILHGGAAAGDNLGFAAANPSAVARAALGPIASPIRTLRLAAPAADQAGWHGLEPGSTGPYRWTAHDTITWEFKEPLAGPARLRVTLPYVMEIDAGFAAACTLSAGAASQPVSVGDLVMEATLPLDAGGASRITLTTPPPLIPAQLRDSADNRPLGLAIPV
jgi:2-polyprenyl-6-hydroxyphenyl methylase/3-demethylubiquinone-9 3-methyltransferase